MKCQIFTMALALAPLASATAWPDILPNMDALIVRRQDSTKTTPTDGPQETNPPDNDQPTEPTNTNPKGPITTDLNTGGNTATETGTPVKGSGSQTKADPKPTMFDPQDPAGGVVMVTPAASLGSQLIKVEGTPATWVWNYTSVQGTPTAVDVLIHCSFASQTITLTQNMTYDSPQTFTWDHAAYAETAITDRLVVDKYTLIVYDAEGSPTEQADAGYLAPFNQFVFGVYTGQPYKDLDDGWQCVTCNGANGSVDRTAIGFAMSMSIITVLSFTWFVTGFGVTL